MDAQLQFKLIEEVRQQCRFGQIAMRQLKTDLWALDAERVFFYVHAFLGHAVALSRLFWPERPSSEERGALLRQELKVADDAPLQMRALRAELEHYDEHLEDWIGSLTHRNFHPMNVMPQGTLGGAMQDTFHRNLDPDTLRLEYRGVTCELRRVADQMHKIETDSDYWLRHHNPW